MDSRARRPYRDASSGVKFLESLEGAAAPRLGNRRRAWRRRAWHWQSRRVGMLARVAAVRGDSFRSHGLSGGWPRRARVTAEVGRGSAETKNLKNGSNRVAGCAGLPSTPRRDRRRFRRGAAFRAPAPPSTNVPRGTSPRGRYERLHPGCRPGTSQRVFAMAPSPRPDCPSPHEKIRVHNPGHLR